MIWYIFLYLSVVSPPSSHQCSASRPYEVTSSSGYIANTENAITCSWLITAQRGQVINVTVIDTKPQANQGHCQSLGSITDLESSKETVICKNNERKQHLYTSSGPKLQIALVTANSDDSFLLHYEGKI